MQTKAPANLDYTNAPSAKEPWRVSREVIERDAAGPIWEVPIYSKMRRRFRQITLRRLRAKFSKNIPKAQQYDMVNKLGVSKNPIAMLKFLLQPFPTKLDFHNQSASTLYHWIKTAPRSEKGNPDVIVLIGHTKEHTDDHGFEKFLALVKADRGLKVSGFGEIAQLLSPRVTSPAKSGEAAVAERMSRGRQDEIRQRGHERHYGISIRIKIRRCGTGADELRAGDADGEFNCHERANHWRRHPPF